MLSIRESVSSLFVCNAMAQTVGREFVEKVAGKNAWRFEPRQSPTGASEWATLAKEEVLAPYSKFNHVGLV